MYHLILHKYLNSFIFSRIANPAFRNLPIHVFTESAMKLLEVMEKVDNEPIDAKNLMHR